MKPESEVMTDLEIVRRVQAGDTNAFGDLIERHQRSVYGIVSRMVYTRDDIDDLAQEIFLLAFKSIKKFRGDAKFSTWLHAIAVNTTIKRLKKLKRRNEVSIDDPETGLSAVMAHDGGESMEDRERNEAVRRAIETLPEKHRIVVIMHYYEEHSCSEIAAALGCSVGTIWSRLHYACKKLKGELCFLEGGI